MKKLRNWINDNSTVVTVGAVVAMIAALFVMFQMFSGGGGGRAVEPPTQAWYYDLKAKRLFPGNIDAIPPIAAPSGNMDDGSMAGFRAHVYACGTCDKPDDYKIAFLEAYSPDAKTKLEAEIERLKSEVQGDYPLQYLLESVQVTEGHFIMSLDEGQWHDWTSEEGRKIQSVFRTLSQECRAKGKDVRLRPCWPGR